MRQLLKILIPLLFIFEAGAQGRKAAKPAPTPTPAPVPQASPAAPKNVVTLSPEDVARLVLSQGDRTREINANTDLARAAYAEILGRYDFTLNVETGYQQSKFPGDQVNSDRSESYISIASLERAFSTGTRVGLEASRNSSRYDLLPTAPAGSFEQSTAGAVGLVLTQNLWRNFFGEADRADLNAARKSFRASQVARVDQLQGLVLEALRAFWSAYVAQESFQESVNSRDRYKKLVDAVRRKSGYGYAGPGELSQALAEFEVREQNVKTSSVQFLSAVDSLATLLNLPRDVEIRFRTLKDIPPPPTLATVDLEKLRSIQTARLRKEAAEDSYRASLSRNRADLSLVGRVASSGFDEASSESDNELLSGSRPRTYVGVRYTYQFGSGAYDEAILNRRLNKELEEARFSRTQREIADALQRVEREAAAAYSVAVSARSQSQHRERAVNELTRTFNQGRTDIQNLIEVLNKFHLTQIEYARAVGQYQIALNEWAALRDELIPDGSKVDPQIQPELPTEEAGGETK